MDINQLIKDKERALKLYAAGKNYTEISTILGRARSSVRNWISDADDLPDINKIDTQFLRQMKQEDEIKELKTQLLSARRTSLTEKEAIRIITGLAEHPIRKPNWLLKPHKINDMGVPVVFLSDFHWGERVEPSEINGVNYYDTPTGKKRERRCFERASGLIVSAPGYSSKRGAVILLGGDMVSGDIHEELKETNDAPPMVALLDLAEELVNSINELLKQGIVDKLHLAGVTGNHGRNTIKPRGKRRVFSNYDWLLYQIMFRELRHNPNITFDIPSGPDSLFYIGNWPCLLTHGDMMGVKGGDGIISVAGPIIRGDVKMRSQAMGEERPYNTLFMGHFHTPLFFPSRIVANGSLVGASEYSRNMLRAPSTPPSQTLVWLNSARGITRYEQIFVEDSRVVAGANNNIHTLLEHTNL